MTMYRESPPGGSLCWDSDFTKMTLKTAYDQTFTSLIADPRGQTKFEASDVIIVDNNFYAICDNSWSIQVIGRHFIPLDKSSYQIGYPEIDSDFESIVYDNITETFYLIRESVPVFNESDKGNLIPTYRSIVLGVKITDGGQNYTVHSTCVSEMEFDDQSKGFEGAISMRDAEGNFYLLGLCEGNLCHSGDTGKRPGGGRIVVMKKEDTTDTSNFSCRWSTVRVMDIPSSANFEDYSAIAFNANTGKVAITSQQYSQIWIGHITLPGGAFNALTSELVSWPKYLMCIK